MSNSIEIESSEAEVTVAGISTDPPTITLVHVGQDAGGVRRDFVQQVPIPDVDLAHRALSEIHKGDRVRVTVINEWREDGCDTYLADFQRVVDPKAELVTTGGARDIAHDSIIEIVMPSVQKSKTSREKARK